MDTLQILLFLLGITHVVWFTVDRCASIAAANICADFVVTVTDLTRFALIDIYQCGKIKNSFIILN